MWIYFNKNGQILETLEHGNIPNVGTTNFEIFAYFEGVNIRTDYPGANLKLIRPDLNQSSHEILPMKPVKRIFTNGVGNVNNYFVNGATYEGFLFNFNDFEADDEVVKLLDTPGLWTAIITLLSSSHGSANVQGEATFNVGNSNVRLQDVFETNDTARINELMNLLATKLNINSDFYLRVLDDVNEYVLEHGIFNNGIFNLNDVLFSKSDKDFYRIVSLSPASVEKIGLDLTFNLENGDAIGSVVNKLAGNIANGEYSIALGYRTQTNVDSLGQTVVGKYNYPDRDAIFIVGNGNGSQYTNAFAVFEDGHAEVSSMKDNPYSVVQKIYVDNEIGDIQHRIEVLHAGSDVKDVVGTYQELSNYNISSLTLNDIIKVLQDETKEDATTYYRWNGNSFNFIGSVGPYYTIGETNSKLSNTLSYSKEYTDEKIYEVEKEINDFLLDHEEETYNNFSSVAITEANGSLIESGQRASLKEIGAFSYVENQLIDISNYSDKATSGITITANKETGVITLNGTCTGTTWCSMGNIPTLANHKYLIISSNKTITPNINGSTFASGNYWKIINPTTDNPTAYYSFYLSEGTTYTNISFTLKIIDLTLMGLDNITTIAEWEALGIEIPNEYVAPHIVSAKPTTLKSYGEYATRTFSDRENWKLSSNGFFFITLYPNAKPSANGDVVAQGSFDGYAPTSRNNIANVNFGYCIDTSGSLLVRDVTVSTVEEFKQKVAGKTIRYIPAKRTEAALLGTINITLPQTFISAGNAKDKLKVVPNANGLYDLIHVSNVGSIDMGTMNFSYQSAHNRFYSSPLANIQPNSNTAVSGNIKCDKYNPVGLEVFANNDKVIAIYNKNIFIKDTQYIDPVALKQSLSGFILNYAKANATETIIATDLTFDQISLLVEYGGLLYIDKPGCDITMDYIVKRSKILNIGVERDESNPSKTITAFYTPVVVYNEDKSKKVEVGDYVGNDAFGIYTPTLEVEAIEKESSGPINVYADFDMNGNKVTGLPEPTEDSDAVNKSYVSKLEDKVFELEAMLYGSIWKESVAIYPRLNAGVIDKDNTSLPIVSNQYGSLKEIKAFSYVKNQLVDYSTAWFVDKSAKGVEFVVNKVNGTISVTGTCTETGGVSFNEIDMKNNHIYIIYSDKLAVNITGSRIEEGTNVKIVKLTADQKGYPSVWVTQDQVYNIQNATFKVIDLTLMFGAGNEPTSIAEWNALGIKEEIFASVDLGTVNWAKQNNNRVDATIPNIKIVATNDVINAQCEGFTAISWQNSSSSTSNYQMAFEPTYNRVAFYIQNGFTDVSTSEQIQALFNGVILTYETNESYGTPRIVSSAPTKLTTYGYNLLNINRTLGTLDGFDNTLPRQFEENKYYVGLTRNNYYEPNYIQNYVINRDSISLTTSNAAYGIGFPVKVIPGQTYYLKYLSTELENPGTTLTWYDKNGNYISSPANAQNGVIAPENAYWGVICLRPNEAMNQNITFSNIYMSHIDLGYKPYIEPSEINLTLPTQFISAGTSKDVVKAVEKANGLYDLVHVSNVGSVLIPDLPWIYGSNGFSCEFLDMKNTTTLNAIGLLCPKYTRGTASEDKSIRTTGKFIGIVDSAYVDVASFKNANTGVPIYYEKAQPTETVIASNLTEEQLKFILQRGGVIAANEPGCDFTLNVVAVDIAE